jgi:hypothetical protein
MAVAKSLDSGKRPALKRRAKQQRPVNQPEKARRASLISPTVYRRAFAAGEELTLQQPYTNGCCAFACEGERVILRLL